MVETLNSFATVLGYLVALVGFAALGSAGIATLERWVRGFGPVPADEDNSVECIPGGDPLDPANYAYHTNYNTGELCPPGCCAHPTLQAETLQDGETPMDALRRMKCT